MQVRDASAARHSTRTAGCGRTLAGGSVYINGKDESIKLVFPRDFADKTNIWACNNK